MTVAVFTLAGTAFDALLSVVVSLVLQTNVDVELNAPPAGIVNVPVPPLSVTFPLYVRPWISVPVPLSEYGVVTPVPNFCGAMLVFVTLAPIAIPVPVDVNTLPAI